MRIVSFDRRRAIARGALFASCSAVAFAAQGSTAYANIGSAKIVGASCDKPFQSGYRSEDLEVSEAHPLDGEWVDLKVDHTDDVAAGTRRYEISWSIAPGMLLCESTAKLGYGKGKVKLERSGSMSVVLKPRSPVRIKIRARFPGEVRLRRDLGTARRRALITGWARRSCQLRSSNPGAAGLLKSVAGRGHGQGCKGPGKGSIPAATQLLHHVSAYFNARSHAREGSRSRPMAHEYYRILRQLTRGTPVPPRG